MRKNTGILLSGILLLMTGTVQAEEPLVSVVEIDSQAAEQITSPVEIDLRAVEHIPSAAEIDLQEEQMSLEETEVIILSDSWQVQFQTISGGDYVSVEIPVLVQMNNEQVYGYVDEVNRKFLEEANASVETEEASMEETYNWILENGNPELAENICYETVCESVYLLGSAYSVMQSHYTYSGGAHPYSWVTGVTYDLNTGEEMTMGEILGCDEETAREAVVLAYWDEIIGQVEYITEESIRENFDAMEYWFDEEGMRVSLAPYIVASYAAGPQDVLVTQEHVAQARG